MIFVGKVLAGGVDSIQDDPWHKSAKFVRFEVIEAFQGISPGTRFVDVETKLWPGMCSPNPYFPGRTYLVSPVRDRSGDGGKLTDGPCFSGQDVERFNTADTIEYLRARFRHDRQSQQHPPHNSFIYGTVKMQVGSKSANDRRERAIEPWAAKPLQGVKVSASFSPKRSGAGNAVSAATTTTDARGRYVLRLPNPGTYSIRATLALYQPVQESFDIPGEGGFCVPVDLKLTSHSSISGRLLDSKGMPWTEWDAASSIGLIEVSKAAPAARSWFRTVDSTPGVAGSFVFHNVPLGRYWLVFNPPGPHPQKPFGPHRPLETTYYPRGAATPAEAQVIEIDRAGMRVTGKDIVVGSPVAFRWVTVKVRFPDGTPMSTAQVDIIGEPLHAGGLPWLATEFPARPQASVHVQVPVNRKFRIAIGDQYGRRLPRTYESTHDPGSTPVSQEFTVAVP